MTGNTLCYLPLFFVPLNRQMTKLQMRQEFSPRYGDDTSLIPASILHSDPVGHHVHPWEYRCRWLNLIVIIGNTQVQCQLICCLAACSSDHSICSLSVPSISAGNLKIIFNTLNPSGKLCLHFAALDIARMLKYMSLCE